jgi:restriction system protein
MLEITAQELRNIISEIIQPTIQNFRASKASIEERDFDSTEYDEVTDEEIDDFILSNPLFDEQLKEQLFDPGLLGFFHKTATVNKKWVVEFKKI